MVIFLGWMSKTGNGLCILKSCLCCSAFEGHHTTKTSKGAHRTYGFSFSLLCNLQHYFYLNVLYLTFFLGATSANCFQNQNLKVFLLFLGDLLKYLKCCVAISLRNRLCKAKTWQQLWNIYLFVDVLCNLWT